MPCTPAIPQVPSVSLPAGVSLAPPEAALPSLPKLTCCTAPTLPTPSIPVPFGSILTLPPVVTAMRAALAMARTWLDAQLHVCPRE